MSNLGHEESSTNPRLTQVGHENEVCGDDSSARTPHTARGLLTSFLSVNVNCWINPVSKWKHKLARVNLRYKPQACATGPGGFSWFNAALPSVGRLWHTACASEEGEVIVFGGCANNLLAHSKAVSVF